jgi:hypothetical protein
MKLIGFHSGSEGAGTSLKLVQKSLLDLRVGYRCNCQDSDCSREDELPCERAGSLPSALSCSVDRSVCSFPTLAKSVRTTIMALSRSFDSINFGAFPFFAFGLFIYNFYSAAQTRVYQRLSFTLQRTNAYSISLQSTATTRGS